MRKTASQVADEVLEKCGMPFRADIKYHTKWLKDIRKLLSKEKDKDIAKMLKGDESMVDKILRDTKKNQAAFEKQTGGKNLDQL